MVNRATAIRASFEDSADDAVEYINDGILLVENGLVAGFGREDKVTIPKHAQTVDLSDRLIVPGFVDTHVHFPQVDVIASYGTQLLDWLEQYTFPEEARYSDAELGEQTASFFLDELLRNGTTTALVFGTVHPESVAHPGLRLLIARH